MRKILTFLLLVLALPAFGQRVTVTVTVTNRAVTSNSLTIGSSFRYFTNAQSSSTFATNLTSINATKTNVFNQIAAFPYTAITLQDVGTNSFRLVASAASLATALGGTWGYITTNSTYGPSNTVPMVYPYDNLLGDTNKTNQASASVDGINRFATNLFTTNATALGNYLTKGASTQQVVIAPAQFNATLRAAGGLAATNGFTSALTNINPVTSNLVNYGSAIRSEGPGGNSLQVGSNAWALGGLSVAIGNNSLATNDNSMAIGTGASATNAGSMAIGTSASARGAGGSAIAIGDSSVATNYAVALGSGALAIGSGAISIGTTPEASGESSIVIGGVDSAATAYGGIAIGLAAQVGASHGIAIGLGAGASHSNSAAIGPQDHAGTAVATTATNQIRLGTANHHVSIPGQLLISGTQSNTTFTGTNIAGGSWSFPRFDLTTLAAGNNIAVPFGTNYYIRCGAGPASAATICGIVGGATTGGLDGQVCYVFNDTGHALTFAQNTSDPIPANRIATPSGSDVTIIDQGWANLTYDATDSRWKVTATYPTTATATNAVSLQDGSMTNATAWQTLGGTSLTVRSVTGSGQPSFKVLGTNGADALTVTSNAQVRIQNGIIFGQRHMVWPTNVAPGSNIAVVVEGDSFASHQTETWAVYLSNRCSLLGLTFTTNAAVGGDYASNINATFEAQLGPFAPTNTSVATILLVECGYNDLTIEDSAETIWGNISNIWAKGRASGYLVGGTTIRGSAGHTPRQMTNRFTLNSYIRRYATNAAWLVDMDAIVPNPFNPLIVYDGTHITNQASEVLERIIEKELFSGYPHDTLLSGPFGISWKATTISPTNTVTESNSVALTVAGRVGQVSSLLEFQMPLGTVVSSISSNGGFRAIDGSVTFPGISFHGDTAQGFYRPSSSRIGYTVGNSERVAFGSVSGGGTTYSQSSGAAPWMQSGTTITGPDLMLYRDGSGVFAQRNSTSAQTNRVAATVTGGPSMTNAAWLESGYDGALGHHFLRSLADGTVQTPRNLAISAGTTNPAIVLNTNGGVHILGPGLAFSTNAVAEGNVAYGGFIATNSISFTNGQRQVLQFTNNWLYLQATNLDAMSGGEMRDIEVELQPQHFYIATNRVIVINSAWKRFSGAVTNTIGSNKIGILRLRRRANTEASVAASFEPEL